MLRIHRCRMTERGQHNQFSAFKLQIGSDGYQRARKMNICLLAIMNINQNSTLYYEPSYRVCVQCALFASSSLSPFQCCFFSLLFIFVFYRIVLISVRCGCIGEPSGKVKRKNINSTRLLSDQLRSVDGARLLSIWFPISTFE